MHSVWVSVRQPSGSRLIIQLPVRLATDPAPLPVEVRLDLGVHRPRTSRGQRGTRRPCYPHHSRGDEAGCTL
jgi:hypothetical protein